MGRFDRLQVDRFKKCGEKRGRFMDVYNRGRVDGMVTITFV